MPTLSRQPIEEAISHAPRGGIKEPGKRKARMAEFDEYAKFVSEGPDEATVFSDVEGNVQRFVLSLKAALKRLGLDARVTKKRKEPTVLAWIIGSAGAPEDDSDLEDVDGDEDDEDDTPTEPERALAGMAKR